MLVAMARPKSTNTANTDDVELDQLDPLEQTEQPAAPAPVEPTILVANMRGGPYRAVRHGATRPGKLAGESCVLFPGLNLVPASTWAAVSNHPGLQRRAAAGDIVAIDDWRRVGRERAIELATETGLVPVLEHLAAIPHHPKVVEAVERALAAAKSPGASAKANARRLAAAHGGIG